MTATSFPRDAFAPIAQVVEQGAIVEGRRQVGEEPGDRRESVAGKIDDQVVYFRLFGGNVGQPLFHAGRVAGSGYDLVRKWREVLLGTHETAR